MDIQAKIKELQEKQADCEKRIGELQGFKVDLGRQIRKLETKQRQINKILSSGEGADA